MMGVAFKPIGANNFFTSERVMKSLESGQRKKFQYFGSDVRRGARRLVKKAKVLNRKEIRKGKGKDRTRDTWEIYESSKPGEPPKKRTSKGGFDWTKLIAYGYEPETQNVVIGAMLGGSRSGAISRMEHGGTVTIKKTRVVWLGNPPKRVVIPAGKTVKTEKRPFMRPAFDKVYKAKMPAMFADSMKPI